MRKLGFGGRWVNLIMECVTYVSYVVLINGKPGDRTFPTWGLSQVNPLSPYLSLICVEGLNYLINLAEVRAKLRGVFVARGGTKITHLLFVDDCIAFGKASCVE